MSSRFPLLFLFHEDLSLINKVATPNVPQTSLSIHQNHINRPHLSYLSPTSSSLHHSCTHPSSPSQISTYYILNHPPPFPTISTRPPAMFTIFKKPTLSNTLQKARKDDSVLLAFCEQVKQDIIRMEMEEDSQRSWKIPGGLPKELVLKCVKKQNYRCLRFSITSQPQLVNNLDVYTLRVFDFRPNEYYKYGR